MIQTYFGNGKGKTTAAVGSAVRCAGCGNEVLFVQFLKNNDSAEIKVPSEIILTGHTLTEGIADVSEYISEIKEINHPYTKGVSPREGIEF